MTFTFSSLPPVPDTLAKALSGAATRPARGKYAAAGATEPDFVELFPTTEHTGPVVDRACFGAPWGCPACARVMTPRIGWLLRAGAHLAVDQWTYAAQQGEDEFLEISEYELPPVAQRYAVAHPGWLEQFLGTVRDLGLLVSTGFAPRPRSTGEVAALRVILGAARVYLETMANGWADLELFSSFRSLPPHAPSGADEDDLDGELETALDRVAAALLEDDEVAALFDPALTEEALRDVDSGPHLHPRNWFDCFYTFRVV